MRKTNDSFASLILLFMMACRAMALQVQALTNLGRRWGLARSSTLDRNRRISSGRSNGAKPLHSDFRGNPKEYFPTRTNGWENDKAVRPVNERKTRQSGFGTLSMPKAVKAMTVFTAFEMSDNQTTLYPASCTALTSTASSTGAFRVTFTVPAVWLATAESTWGRASNACFT